MCIRDRVETLNPEPTKAKNLNTSRNNYSSVDENMKSKSGVSGRDIATIYGGQLVGLGIDAGINSFVPAQYNQLLKGVLAAGLPLASYFVKMPKSAAEIAVLIGGYLTTRLTEQLAEGYLAPTVGIRKIAVARPNMVGISPTRAVGITQTKYALT